MRLASLITTILLTTLSASADLICEPGDDSQFTCKQAIRGNGETLYHSNGRVMSHSMGSRGATWYNENGSVLTHNGPALSSEEMWEMACNKALR
jgi:hypothetical protein